MVDGRALLAGRLQRSGNFLDLICFQHVVLFHVIEAGQFDAAFQAPRDFLFPLGQQLTFEQAKSLGELLARVVTHELPEIATVARHPGARGGRVYVDFLQNGHGKLLAAPFSARPVPGATCSAPLDWREVKPGLDIKAFTIETLPERMKRLRGDALRPVLESRPDLGAVLARLAERLPG